jgi:hypothetical protein
MAQLHYVPVCFDDFVSVTGPQHNQAWNGAQRRKMFDWLMGRPIFAVAHGVMRENEYCGQFHDRGEPNGGARVIAKDEE